MFFILIAGAFTKEAMLFFVVCHLCFPAVIFLGKILSNVLNHFIIIFFSPGVPITY